MDPTIVTVPLGAHEADLRGAADFDGNIPLVLAAEAVVGRGVPQSFGRVRAFARDLVRSRAIEIEAPVDDVDVMAGPVGELTAGVIHYPTPVPVAAVAAELAVLPPWRRAEPEIPVECLRDREWLFHSGAVSARETDLHEPDLSDTTVADQLAGVVEMTHRSLPTAGLPDTAVTMDRVADRPALPDRSRERFLAKDVETGTGSHDGRDSVPLIGQGQRDCIQVLPDDELAEVGIGAAVAVTVDGVHRLLRPLKMVPVDIAHGHYLGLILVQEAVHVPATL
jgi:hypothetical protein